MREKHRLFEEFLGKERVRVVAFRNAPDNRRPFYRLKVEFFYKKAGQWHPTSTLSENMARAMRLLTEAAEMWIQMQKNKDRKASKAPREVRGPSGELLRVDRIMRTNEQ